jgi:hypothetical protein
MRELKEITADIDKVNGEKRVLDDKLHALYIERGQRVQYDFEQKHGLKRGDLVELRNGKQFYYDYVKPYGGMMFPWVYVRKPKKDGSPSRNVTSFLTDSFTDCKVIGHQELP